MFPWYNLARRWSSCSLNSVQGKPSRWTQWRTLAVALQLAHLPPGENGRHFADDIFNCIFMNEKFWILIRISLKFVPKGQIDNTTTLVQVMAWRQTGDKPLPESMQIKLIDAYMRHIRERWVGTKEDHQVN